MKGLAKFPATAQPGLVAAERIFDFLDTRPEIVDRVGAAPLSGFESEISLEGVTFGYGVGEPRGREVAAVRDVSFTVPKGSVVALVGRSGAG